MRIIAGRAGRIAIKVPPAVARPTTDFVRQAIFSILGERVENARALDLFAGSGAIGLEALSRGAASCVFVDEHRTRASAAQNPKAYELLHWGKNLAGLRVLLSAARQDDVCDLVEEAWRRKAPRKLADPFKRPAPKKPRTSKRPAP